MSGRMDAIPVPVTRTGGVNHQCEVAQRDTPRLDRAVVPQRYGVILGRTPGMSMSDHFLPRNEPVTVR